MNLRGPFGKSLIHCEIFQRDTRLNKLVDYDERRTGDIQVMISQKKTTNIPIHVVFCYFLSFMYE